nr:MAK10-like protein [Tanacetum cinerariifolium]
MTAPSGQATANIREATYYQEYLANVVKHRWFLAGEPARKPNSTVQKVRINILQYLIHLRMCKYVPTKMMKMFLLVENLRQQNPDNREVAVCSSLRSPKSKRTIKSRAKRSSKIISLGHDSTLLASSHTVKSKTDIKSPTRYPCGGENPIRTLGDYSRPSHKGYMNAIELPEGNNVLRDLNPEESWAILEDLALYDNESWNDPRDFAKPVKAIALPQDVSSTSDRRQIKLENQVQRSMEAHLTLTRPTQVNKITTPCEICSGSYDTQYCLKNPEQAFVEYASLRTNEVRGKWYTFNPEQNNLDDTYNPSWRSHLNLRWRQPQNSPNNFSNPPNRFQPNDARLSKFEADFKRQQRKMTNKIDIVLKAITDRIAGTLLSDAVKNPKLGTHPVSSARSYLVIDPQCSSHLSTSINDIKAHFNDALIEPQQKEEPEQPLMTNLNIFILTYRLAFVQGETLVKIGDPELFTLPCRLWDSEPLETLANLGSCVNIIPLYLIKKLNIGLLEETDHIFGLADGTKSYPVGIVKDVVVHIGKLKVLNDFYILDMKKDPETPLLVGRGLLAIANVVIDCRMAKIAVGEGITRSIFSVKGIDFGDEEAPYWTTLGKR